MKEEAIEEIQRRLKKILKKKRYRHTVGVRYTAQALAMRYGEDMIKAGYAGMLHDCAKYLSGEEMLSQCRKHNISCSKTEKKQSYLLHAKLGAYYAKKIYGVEDEEILSSIRWHTTGKPGMTQLEKIIFIADYIEPERKSIPGLDNVRKMAFKDLDETMYLILGNTLSYLEANREGIEEPIDRHTVDAFQYYKGLHDRKKKML